MQLLKITSIPIKYQIQIERARLEMKREGNTQANIQRTPSRLQIRSRNIEMRMDSTEMRSSLDIKSVGRRIAEAAQKGRQAAMEATAEYAQDGQKLMQKGVDITQIIADKLFNQQPSSTLVFLPTTGPAITWQPNSMQMQYDPGDLKMSWELMRNTMDYVPGKFQMNILQYPKVRIEYLGEPSYVPPSANPNYHEKA